MSEFDIDNPFKHLYRSDMPRCAPDAVNESHLAIQTAVQALADKGQVFVWVLEEHDESSVLSGVFASLRGAIEGAMSITTDEIVIHDLDAVPSPEDTRIYVNYLSPDTKWEFVNDPAIGHWLGFHIKTIDGAGAERHWTITWQELLP